MADDDDATIDITPKRHADPIKNIAERYRSVRVGWASAQRDGDAARANAARNVLIQTADELATAVLNKED